MRCRCWRHPPVDDGHHRDAVVLVCASLLFGWRLSEARFSRLPPGAPAPVVELLALRPRLAKRAAAEEAARIKTDEGDVDCGGAIGGGAPCDPASCCTGGGISKGGG